MKDISTIELKTTVITTDRSTWPLEYKGFILECHDGSHDFCNRKDEWFCFYGSLSVCRKVIDCLGLRWAYFPGFPIEEENKLKDKK